MKIECPKCKKVFLFLKQHLSAVKSDDDKLVLEIRCHRCSELFDTSWSIETKSKQVTEEITKPHAEPPEVDEPEPDDEPETEEESEEEPEAETNNEGGEEE